MPIARDGPPRSPPLNHDADEALHAPIEPTGLNRHNVPTTIGMRAVTARVLEGGVLAARASS